jgi:hypothetical protein
MSVPSPSHLEADTELREQLQDDEQHILAGFRRLSPSHQLSMLELVDKINEAIELWGL